MSRQNEIDTCICHQERLTGGTRRVAPTTIYRTNSEYVREGRPERRSVFRQNKNGVGVFNPTPRSLSLSMPSGSKLLSLITFRFQHRVTLVDRQASFIVAVGRQEVRFTSRHINKVGYFGIDGLSEFMYEKAGDGNFEIYGAAIFTGGTYRLGRCFFIHGL